MPDTPDSTNKIVPPFSPLRVEIEPPERKKRRERIPKKPHKEEQEKNEGNSNRGKAVDVVI
jgi:hypothetical protein